MNRWVVAVACVVLTAAFVAASEPAAATLTPAVAQETAAKYTEQFYAGQLSALHGKFTTAMKESMNLEAFQTARSQFDQQLGTQTELLDERIEEKDEYLIYVRRARFEKYPGVIEVQWLLTDDKSIAGFFLSPEKQRAD